MTDLAECVNSREWVVTYVRSIIGVEYGFSQYEPCVPALMRRPGSHMANMNHPFLGVEGSPDSVDVFLFYTLSDALLFGMTRDKRFYHVHGACCYSNLPYGR